MIRTLILAAALSLSPLAQKTKVEKKKDSADLLIVGLTISAIIATVVIVSSDKQKPASP